MVGRRSQAAPSVPGRSWGGSFQLPPNFGKSSGNKEGCAQGAGFVGNTWMGQDEDLGLGFWVSFFIGFSTPGLEQGRSFQMEPSQNLGEASQSSSPLPCVLFSFGHSWLDSWKTPGWDRMRIWVSGLIFVGFSTPGLEQRKDFQVGPLQVKLGKLPPLPCVSFSFGHSWLDWWKSPGWDRTRICLSIFGFLGYFW